MLHLRGGKVDPSNDSERKAESGDDFAVFRQIGHGGDHYLAHSYCKPETRVEG